MTAAMLAPQDAIEVAATIGFGIARRAVWSGERCTWFDAIPTLPTQNPATSMMAGPDVYGGTSGIGWFLAQAAARSGDALLRHTARATTALSPVSMIVSLMPRAWSFWITGLLSARISSEYGTRPASWPSTAI